MVNALVEKCITLDHISLRELVGAENCHLKKITAAFPEAKLIVRGEEIHIQGTAEETEKIHNLLTQLIKHCEQEGDLRSEDLDAYMQQDRDPLSAQSKDKDFIIIHTASNQIVRPQTAHQIALFQATQRSDMVFAIGPAGSGKTFLAVAIALRALRRKEVKRIVITRPAVEAGEHLGFLPGNLNEKMDPYLLPIYDVLREILSEERLRFFREKGIIEIAPLAYMRGRTMNDSFILLDEAQNAISSQLKMFLTRLGLRSKAIITGDVSQIDLPEERKSGLAQAIGYLKDVDIPVIWLDESDVMRHPLVKKILKAYATQSHTTH